MSDDLFSGENEPRRTQKSEAAFRTISEVSQELEVPQHVLRFWEGRFPQVKPLKRGGGRRYYRPEDVLLLKRIRDLLYKEGYTIRGVQKLLRDTARGGAVEHDAEPDNEEASGDLEDARPPPIFGAGLIASLADPIGEEQAEEAELPELELPVHASGEAETLLSRGDLLALKDELERLRGILTAALRPASKI